MMFVDLVSEDEEQASPTSLGSLCRLFEIPHSSFVPISLPPHLESPESPNVNIRHPCDVCPTLSPGKDVYRPDTDLRFNANSPINPAFASFPSPDYPADNDTFPYTAQELDDALLYLPVTPCPVVDDRSPIIADFTQRLVSLENRQRNDSLVLEGMINTLAVDLVNLTQGLNQRLTQVSELLQRRRHADMRIHRHTGDILARLIYHPTLHQQLSHDLLGEVQRLRRRTLFD